MVTTTRSAKPIKRIVFICTYPPQHCGIATFSQDLMRSIGLLLPEVKIEACAINKRDMPIPDYPPEVIFEIDQDKLSDYSKAAAKINRRAEETLVIVQHEYGIFGGKYGDYIVELLDKLDCPVITTFHTVIDNPSTRMRRTTSKIIKKSDQLVVLAATSVQILHDLYPRSAKKVNLIGHGIHPVNFRQSTDAKQKMGLVEDKVLMTFGLLSRNKGIEYVIKGLPKVIKKFPSLVYLVIGETHPIVKLYEGEAYRQELEILVKKLGITKHVRFINEYMSVKQILDYLQASDLYIATSLDPKQTVSGTLTYALGAGCAVVTTGFSQAKEIVHEDMGRVVSLGSSEAMSSAILQLLADPDMLNKMSRAAFSSTRSILWSNIGDNYINLMDKLLRPTGRSFNHWPSINITHLKNMTDELGLVQFANGAVPDKPSGYTLDDNSRALQTLSYAHKYLPNLLGDTSALSKKYIKLIDACLGHKPIANYLKINSGVPTKQNLAEDLGDSVGRAYYALQLVAHGSLKEARQAGELIKKLPTEPDDHALRPSLFYLLGACAAVDSNDLTFLPLLKKMAGRLVDAFNKNSTDNWQWFEPQITYANGQLCAGLIEAARLTGSKSYRKIGLASLDFLIQKCFMGEVYVPIGQNGWYSKGSDRALFDQQPEDALACIQAFDSAYRLTEDDKYIGLAKKAFSWYLGNNLVGCRMYDDQSGGCHDGLKPRRANPNEGAESLLAYLQARLIIEKLSANL